MKRLSKLFVGGVAAALTMTAFEGRAATYVISTDDQFNEVAFPAFGATNGYNSAGYVFLGPTRPGTINGTPVHFYTYTNNTAVYGVAGTLNLGSTDSIVGVGTRFLKLEVGADANISGLITVQGFQQFPGSGGGLGGARGYTTN